MYLVLWCCKLLFCYDTETGEVGMLVRTARGGNDFRLSISFEKYVHCPVLLSLDIHHITFFLIIWTLSQVLVCKSTVTGALCTKPGCSGYEDQQVAELAACKEGVNRSPGASSDPAQGQSAQLGAAGL